MVYYKIPISNGVFDYPAGCILYCAYPVGGYMYCKFESVTETGAGWLTITESEFDVRRPDFPDPEKPPVHAVIATSAKLADGFVVLELPASVDTGTLVKFTAPCACSAVTGGIVINGVTYAVVDALGNVVTGAALLWDSGAQVAVLIDTAAGKAYIQNGAELPLSGGTMTGPIDMDGHKINGLGDPVDSSDAVPKSYADKKTSISLLWENENPKASFAAQTITIPNLSEYTHVGVVADWMGAADVAQLSSMQIYELASMTGGNLGVISMALGDQIASRTLSYDGTTGIAFKDARLGSTTQNRSVIPQKIYGIKGVW